MPPMILFATATLIPLPLILIAAFSGGFWALAAPLYMTVMTAVLDEWVDRVTPATSGAEFPAANALSITIALGQFAIIVATVFALTSDLAAPAKIGVFIAASLYIGQVGNSNAHELIHRSSRFLRNLGKWAYISVLFGHHTSAHVLVHHIHVGTKNDPNTSRLNESFYRFFGRAWRGSVRKSYAAETKRMALAGKPKWSHPFVTYIGGAIAMVCIAGAIGGAAGIGAYLALAFFAQIQLMLSDYVQHYGLTRTVDDAGKPEPVAAKHSWNSPHWFSSALMLNAPRHSDHHVSPMTIYPALQLPDAPLLPRSLPIMACVALVPPLWRRVMNPRVAQWQETAL